MTYAPLTEIAEQYRQQVSPYERSIVVCAGTGCLANGSQDVYDAFMKYAEEKGFSLSVALKKEEAKGLLKQSGCQGFCQKGPLVEIYPEGFCYIHVKPEDVPEIIEKTLLRGEVVERLTFHDSDGTPVARQRDIPFYARQKRTTLEFCGSIDASDVDEYIARGGYEAAARAVLEMTPDEICGEIMASGLRGRGGGGFPTGTKWGFARREESNKKYIICNGDEGDPGAFMDRCLMEGNPHSVIEGMTIAARAIGADEGYIYVRAEYPLAVRRLHNAVKEAEEYGFLGDSIFGSEHSFRIHIFQGAGAFVCGEETALIASIEGKRGMPMPKPPFPASSGLFGKPTIINNVETLSSVPVVLREGAEKYLRYGTATSHGTKTFALTGHVANTGLIEVPFGATLREIIGDIGGGVISNGENVGLDFKAVQIGGPSGGCLTQEHLDLPLDYETLRSVGAMVGSGGLVVVNQNTCMVQLARFFMQFTQNESCGKCTVCREGTKQMLNLLDDIMAGSATMETLDLLEDLAETVKIGALCGLGKTAPNPVLSTLRYFRDEYIAHIEGKYCPTHNCKALATYRIVEDLCKRCGLCQKHCPVNAIKGSRHEGFVIDLDVCSRCGTCCDSCHFSAIELV